MPQSMPQLCYASARSSCNAWHAHCASALVFMPLLCPRLTPAPLTPRPCPPLPASPSSGPNNNLASNINVGLGSRPFKSGGSTSRGAYAAANNTWWNIYPANRRALALPPCSYGPLLTWVGLYGAPDDAGWKDDNSDRRKLLQQDDEPSDGASNNRNSSISTAGSYSPSLVTDGPGWDRNRAPLAAPAGVVVSGTVAGGAKAAAGHRFPGWCAGARWWVENTEAGRGIQPPDLHAAMVAKRLRR